MSDYGGALRLSYIDSNSVTHSYDLGSITDLNETFQKKTLTVPLVTLPASRAFTVESGNSRAYSINFTRKSPDVHNDTGSDPTKWSNAYWYAQLTAAVDRWQCLSDGFTLTYTPGSSGLDDHEDCPNPYIPPFGYNSATGSYITELNGYVRSLTRTYKAEYNQSISGTLVFAVGTMYVSSDDVPIPTNLSGTTAEKEALLPSPISKTAFSITMSSSDRSTYYYLLNDANGLNCVDSYTLSGGISNPFESLTMDIPRKKLVAVAPALENDILAGKNKIQINAVGRSNLTVVKCSLSDNTYTITAYCEAAIVKGSTLASAGSAYADAWIENIMRSFGIAYIHSPYNSSLTSGNNILSFNAGQNIWYILQVCAAYLGCKIFFADNRAYVSDFASSAVYGPGSAVPVFSYGAIDLYNRSSTSMYGRVLGSVSLGSEGTDTVVNVQTIYCSDTYGTIQSDYSETFKSGSSVSTFGEMEGNTLYVPELVEGTNTDDNGVETTYHQASTFANGIFKYRAEPQQSISFTVKEMIRNGTSVYWRPCFATPSRITSVTDEVDDIVVNNASYISSSSTVPQKFLLSGYERHYPAGTTTYTFGVVENVDLSTSTQQLSTNLSNVNG